MNQYQHSFRSLIAWREAKIFSLRVYKITSNFPSHELYAMSSQLRRASSSVMANLAEGNERRTKKDKLHFFQMSRSSLAESDAFLEIAHDLGYVNQQDYSSILDQLNKTAFLTNRLILSLQ